MWVKVLPADPPKEVYFVELSDRPYDALREIGKIVGGHPELVKSQALADKYGYNEHNGMPLVVMIVNEEGQRLKLPINVKGSYYYPNDYDIPIRGDVVLTGFEFVVSEDPEGMGYDIASMPPKWKIIYDMETALAEGGDDYEKVHSALDELLLAAADPDVRKMYEEAREQFNNWPTA